MKGSSTIGRTTDRNSSGSQREARKEGVKKGLEGKVHGWIEFAKHIADEQNVLQWIMYPPTTNSYTQIKHRANILVYVLQW